MNKKVLALVEELNPDSEILTDDPDIAAKINAVTNQIMFELARIKKIVKFVEVEVTKGDRLTFEDLEAESGYEVFQLGTVSGVLCDFRANGTVIKALESGTAEIDLYVYPERIDEKTNPKAYEFELSADVLEIMPYGIAGDLLKSDVSADYGSVYSARYESMLARLDPRYQTAMISIEGGVKI
jgi:hypothetical protein